METNELKEIKNELRLLGDSYLISIGACKTASEIIETIGKHMYKLSEVTENAFVAVEPEKETTPLEGFETIITMPSRIIIP